MCRLTWIFAWRTWKNWGVGWWEDVFGLWFKKKITSNTKRTLSYRNHVFFPAKSDREFQSFLFLNLHSPIKSNGCSFNITESFLFWISYTGKFKMNDDILQKQVLSITIEFRVSDTVQEFKMFNKSLFLHLPSVINHMEALWEFISVSITNAHSKSLINDCCLLNLTVNQLRQAAQKWATYRPLCGLVYI